MKNYIKIIALIIVGSFASCKDFLEEKQISNLTQAYYNDENGLNSLINGLYVYARVKHEWDGNGSKLIEPETDSYMHTNTNFARIGAAEYGSELTGIAANVNNYIGAANASNAPMGAYPHINNCNIALDIIDNIRPGRFGTDETYRKSRRAEVLFLRSWAYYLISNQLGDVPLLLTPTREDNGVYHYPKAPLSAIYRQIITDLRYAYENLPVPAAADRGGRANKYAAGHFLAKVYLNRAQAATFQNSAETHLKMLFKGNVSTDLDSVITISTEVINGMGGPSGLAPDYWTLFDPKVSETNPHKEVLWSAQFDVNTALNGRFQNRSVNYHTGDYTNQTGVTRAMAYGRPFGTYKPTDWGYDNFRDKVNDSRYYKTFQYEYVSNMPNSTSTSYTWSAAAAAWWNANKPAGEPAVTAGSKRILNGTRALIYLENQKEEALDSAMVMSMPFQFMVRWIRSATTGRYYYRLFIDQSPMGLATSRVAPYLSSKKYIDPLRGGSSDEANFNSESGTRDVILMRLAETYLVRAEAYGRKGQYSQAIADINVLRQRAAYKPGENRPNVLVQWEPQASTLAPQERTAPFAATASSYSKIQVSENHFTPGTPEANGEGYIPTVTSKQDMFIHFIYNEKAREFLSEGLQWEDLHNAGILYERVVYLNQMASDKTGLWPVAFNTVNGNGQNGNGKGQYQKYHTFRPWPNAYLVQLTDETGKPLDVAARDAYQNPGY
ncbi:RagB/SusD family nutrient uptake outer membrane protein [Pedobacter sp. SYSU D00535]|uniref:RagB/SusD family nutrient uptake outer membrane protein n=1 Tax=Pedobacter sp. SYSU D00535 TaxID=2810308 RepID=UPI001A9636B5|nr:RagB/SusD family nutrient uptake outer membrane protein [Pedobacter sp. SYSU D00535]